MPWYFNRHGEQLWYEDQGEGVPLILVHGWCMSSRIWQFQYNCLPGCRIIAPDLRGHGASRQIHGAFSLPACVDDLVDLCRHTGIRGAVLAGWSLGGQLAIAAAAALAGNLSGMALIGTTPCFTASESFPYALSHTESQGMRLKIQRNLQRAVAGFHSLLVADGEFTRFGGEEAVTDLLASLPEPEVATVLQALDTLERSDLRPELAGIRVPVLIMHGEQDRVCLPAASTYLQQHIHHAERIEFAGCGHVPFLTDRHRFNQELCTFIRSVCEY